MCKKSEQFFDTSMQSTDEAWEDISEQLEWGPEDCLNHKLTFKEREDMKTTKETLLQHIKRLRALGWHLLMLKDKYAFPECLPRLLSTYNYRSNTV